MEVANPHKKSQYLSCSLSTMQFIIYIIDALLLVD